LLHFDNAVRELGLSRQQDCNLVSVITSCLNGVAWASSLPRADYGRAGKSRQLA